MDTSSFFNLKAIKYYAFLILALILLGIGFYAFIHLIIPLLISLASIIIANELLLHISPKFRHYFVWMKSRAPYLFTYHDASRSFLRERRIAKKNKSNRGRKQKARDKKQTSSEKSEE